ncbi:phosphoribosyltransferase [Ancylothrix sp. C2]|uniref:phosphoribosyltransferase n=1 Tax=Ancylothrix sp. D3o TaxID=2953691 RepID=UPI0021BB4111|nr:phosphoribosyltransferase family protein [Ancylothrix sp. D3o]MCT7950762.1 phosphoribosyltransferase [Ancylothrix sp. D3o]
MLEKPLFCDRTDAGNQLAELVFDAFNQLDTASIAPPIVYALPRGGLPVAVPVARRLSCPLSVILAKKISRQENPELAIGACTAAGDVVWSPNRVVSKLNSQIRDSALQQAQQKAQAQMSQFAPVLPEVNPEGALVILVDDGIATGMTVAVAAKALRAQKPALLWVAAPVAPAEIHDSLCEWADCVLLLATPDRFFSVSRFYEQFPQVEMIEALACLDDHNLWLAGLSQPPT